MHTRHERTIASPVVRKVVAAATVALLFAPGVAWISGSRGRLADNRSPVAFAGLRPGWSSLSRFGSFLADRLPLRSSAIRTDGWVDEHVFREDPAFGGSASPQVMRGRHGQLFLGEDFVTGCQPVQPAKDTAHELAQFASVIGQSGRTSFTMVPPDKSTVLSDELPAAFPERQCWRPNHDALWRALDAASIPGWIDLRALLVQQRSTTGRPLYLPLDSHWDSEGSMVGTKALIDALAPGLFRESEVVDIGAQQYIGDLSVLMGRPESGTTEMYAVQRPDVARVSTDEFGEHPYVAHWVNSAAPGRLIPGKTLILGDSFALHSMQQMAPYFEDLTLVILQANDPAFFTSAIQDADTVVFMSVERHLTDRMSLLFGPTYLDGLTAALAG